MSEHIIRSKWEVLSKLSLINPSWGNSSVESHYTIYMNYFSRSYTCIAMVVQHSCELYRTHRPIMRILSSDKILLLVGNHHV